MLYNYVLVIDDHGNKFVVKKEQIVDPKPSYNEKDEINLKIGDEVKKCKFIATGTYRDMMTRERSLVLPRPERNVTASARRGRDHSPSPKRARVSDDTPRVSTPVRVNKNLDFAETSPIAAEILIPVTPDSSSQAVNSLSSPIKALYSNAARVIGSDVPLTEFLASANISVSLTMSLMWKMFSILRNSTIPKKDNSFASWSMQNCQIVPYKCTDSAGNDSFFSFQVFRVGHEAPVTDIDFLKWAKTQLTSSKNCAYPNCICGGKYTSKDKTGQDIARHLSRLYGRFVCNHCGAFYPIKSSMTGHYPKTCGNKANKPSKNVAAEKRTQLEKDKEKLEAAKKHVVERNPVTENVFYENLLEIGVNFTSIASVFSERGTLKDDDVNLISATAAEIINQLSDHETPIKIDREFVDLSVPIYYFAIDKPFNLFSLVDDCAILIDTYLNATNCLKQEVDGGYSCDFSQCRTCVTQRFRSDNFYLVKNHIKLENFKLTCPSCFTGFSSKEALLNHYGLSCLNTEIMDSILASQKEYKETNKQQN